MSKRIMTLALTALMLLVMTSGVLAAGNQPTVDADYLIVVPGQTGFQVQEMFVLNNSGSSPYSGTTLTDPSGKKKTGWLFRLPSGFQNLQVQGYTSGEYAAVANGVQIYKALPKGQTQVSFIFDLPESSLPATITKQFSFDTTQFYVYTPESYLKVGSDALQPGDALQISGQNYLQYSATSSYKAGQALSFSIDQVTTAQSTPANPSNKAAAGFSVKYHPDAHVALFMSGPLANTNPHIWAAYIFIMLGLAIAAAILYYRWKNKESFAAEEARKVENLEMLAEEELALADEVDEGSASVDDDQFLKLKAKQDLLLQRIKSLDEQYAAGNLAEQQYQANRDKLKELLVQVKLQLKELT